MIQRKTLALTLALGACAATISGAFAQSSEPPTRPKRMNDPEQYYHAPNSIHGKTIVLPIGSTFEGRIDQTISSEHSHAGTRFNIIVDSPVLVNGTDVVIPTGSQITGEVVEAVPASSVPRQKWQDKRLIHGKLRVQISGLRTPEGITYPMVAQLQGEVTDKMHAYMSMYKRPIGTNVGYVGTPGSFEATNANRVNADIMKRKRGMGPQIMSKKDFMKDEVLGQGAERQEPDFTSVRSLVLKHRDYYIYNGSPLTVKVTAPLKVGIASPAAGIPVGSVGDEPREADFPPPSRQTTNGGSFPPPSNTAPMQQPQRGAVPPDSF